MPPSCALLGGFPIGARVVLLWQHNAKASYKYERDTLASALVLSLYAWLYGVAKNLGCRTPTFKTLWVS